MPSPVVERILAEYQRTHGSHLELPPELSANDFMDLTRAVDTFAAVEGLRVWSTDADWSSERLGGFTLGLKKLVQLNLTASVISDTSLRIIAQTLANLTELNLGYCNKVTNAGVTNIARNLSQLTNLNLQHCNKVTDAGVTNIARNLTQLTNLDLGYCNKVTDVGVADIARNLTQLTNLNLGYCNKVTDAGVTNIARNLSQLTNFSLEYCNKVTDAGVADIARNLTQLTDLDLGGCDKVTAIPEKVGMWIGKRLARPRCASTCGTSAGSRFSKRPTNSSSPPAPYTSSYLAPERKTKPNRRHTSLPGSVRSGRARPRTYPSLSSSIKVNRHKIFRSMKSVSSASFLLSSDSCAPHAVPSLRVEVSTSYGKPSLR
ncbi:F-box/LRR-repeat protein 14 OS=Salmo salar GN=FXL14 PE=2 SV=1: LRR_6: LRR_6: LRR_6: LRR_6: LRR_6: LRR_7 [Gemmata massiliana]|uniref:Uncharacterized protein n=1 Tax=Gemmata massiliana TaxID=1210884 RepID=A0A6P2D1A5_9BACT|nr:F-box/LRR-repeat protein 14 OS=Salmo salar GN=FXL14 PE=2 SV=1: LRR_6: LRR_6: LRR_6: LRR_6: LRR_6: LRR_7 [Gemmata massiliana]